MSSQPSAPRVLIIGAGSMGIVTGYHLSLAGAHTTFLIRPHRAAQLSRAQTLYCYDDNTLKTYKDFEYITSPSAMLDSSWDFIIITLDGPALMSETGVELVKTIGEVGRKSPETKVLIGTIGVDLHRWFVEMSGLEESRVTMAWLTIHVYSPSAVTLPLPAASDAAGDVVDPELLKQADQAYTAKWGGYWIDDSSPSVQSAFAELWDKSRVPSTCKSATQLSVEGLPIFAVFAAAELLGWPSFTEIAGGKLDDEGKAVWKLAVEAGKELARLDMHGEVGVKAAEAMTEEGMAGALSGLEQVMRPFDFVAFSKYHHGGKVNEQDRELLKTCLRIGEKEGEGMEKLRMLIQRVWG